MGQRVDLLGAVTRIVPERSAPAIDITSLRSVLIIKLSSIGDVVHALPVAVALKRAHPALRISWVIEEWTAPLIALHPSIDRVVIFPTLVRWPSRPVDFSRRLRAAVRDLRSERYDVAIDLQGLARSAAISALTRSTYRVARAGQREGAHLVSKAVPLPRTAIHAVDEYLHVVRHLGAPLDPVEFLLQVSSEARRTIAAVLAAHRVSNPDVLIVVNMSASQPWKQWPMKRWAEVIDRLSGHGSVVVVGSASQAPAHAEICARTSRRPLDLTGKTSLAELVALLEGASLHVAPDTGSIHIAVALGTPVVAIFGPTRTQRVGPYRRPHSAIHYADLCGPTCPTYCLWHRRCLDAVTADEVIERARDALATRQLSERAARPR